MLQTHHYGSGGPEVFLIHGDVAGGAQTWGSHQGLGANWSVTAVERPGYGDSALVGQGSDYELEAEIIGEIVPDGAHLVGHSYGGVIALKIAESKAGELASLTVSEPPCLGVAADEPEVLATIEAFEQLWATVTEPNAFYREFAPLVGERPWPRPTLPDSLARLVRLLIEERVPWRAELDLERIAQANLPMLVLSSGGRRAFEISCDRIADRTGARRAVLTGHGHSIPRTGSKYDEVVEAFWRSTTHRIHDAADSPGRPDKMA